MRVTKHQGPTLCTARQFHPSPHAGATAALHAGGWSWSGQQVNSLASLRHRTVMRLKRRSGRGLLAGMLGGIAGALVMDVFQHHVWHPRDGTEEDEINENVANIIARRVFDRGLRGRERETTASVVHYVVGAGLGAAYGIAKQFAPVLGRGAGVPFGVVLWLVADEWAAPAMRLADRRRSSWLRSSNELAAHLLYAATLDAVLRATCNPDLRCRGSSTKPPGKTRASKAA